MDKKSSLATSIRVDANLYKRFKSACSTNGVRVGRELERYMTEYIGRDESPLEPVDPWLKARELRLIADQLDSIPYPYIPTQSG